MLITSNQNLHYPIKVVALRSQEKDAVERFAPLFTYTYSSTVTEGDKYGDEQVVRKNFYADFESETEGTLTRWRVNKDDVIEHPGVPLVEIDEPCKHEVQFAGLCTRCGKDMTQVTYATTVLDTNRATITMTANTSLKVSANEASRVSEAARRRLIANKKLSLVIDLDQTIIHATVEPTVADWQKDPSNPNYDAVKDVRAFQLVDEGPGNRVCWYYIKLRPGLMDFLEDISKKYELHIYTMGTRAYAQNIAKIVDPEHKLFGDRILSRDESGSMLVKNLQRLFPVDTKMVVIIDDRGDVWNWNPHLIKVLPYDFFVGIGDINSSFLPKRAKLLKNPKPIAVPQEETASSSSTEESPQPSSAESSNDSETSIEDQIVAMAGEIDPTVLKQQGSEQQEVIESQLRDRPMLHKQEALDKKDEEAVTASQSGENGTQAEPDTSQRHNLLHDDDTELLFLKQHLENVHKAFYSEYERQVASSQGGRVAELRGEKAKVKPVDDLQLVPDIKDIMTPMKQGTLNGVALTFTGVIPQGARPADSDVGMWARSFGATVYNTLCKRTTHVIASKDRWTMKARQATRYPHMKIVTLSWLFDTFARWKRQPEEPYLIQYGEDDSMPPPDENELPDDVGERSGSDDDEKFGEDGVDTELGSDGDDELPSPIEELVKVQNWDEWDAELNEFLGVDADDLTDDETDGGESDASASTASSMRNTTTALNGKKRKRENSFDRASDTGSGGEESVNGTAEVPESQLQKRKKRALERTTSLTHVANADVGSGLPSPETTAPEEENEKAKKNRVEKEGEGDDDDDDDDELERQMLAELERDGDEEEGNADGVVAEA